MQLHQLTAFITWAAWASVANRPGDDFSYTNNFPYDPDVGNRPTSGALLWSALSLLVLLAGIATVLLAFGKFDQLGWITRGQHIHPQVIPGKASAGQRALVKFFVVVALLSSHRPWSGRGRPLRADPAVSTASPGNDLPQQFAAHLAFADRDLLDRHRIRGGRLVSWSIIAFDEPRWLATAVHLLFAAFAVVIRRQPLGEWLGISGLLGEWWFWFGNQGWEYLEIGRFCSTCWWRVVVLVRDSLVAARPRTVANPKRARWPGFLYASLAIPVFYCRRCFRRQDQLHRRRHLALLDHPPVGGGFLRILRHHCRRTAVLQLGLTRRNTALRVIYLECPPVFPRGLIGTGHHCIYRAYALQYGDVGDVLGVGSVPLTLLTLDAWHFVRTTHSQCDVCGEAIAIPHKWTFYFLMSVGFWNFVGAGMFGFLINLPIVSYYEVGTILTPNHGHAAMMGVFGMLALAMMVFVLRQTADEARWASIEKILKVGFWGTNIGLLMMVGMSLFPAAFCRCGT